MQTIRFLCIVLLIRQCGVLLLAILFISVGQLRAAEPLVTIGKPPLGDIAYSPDGRFLATLSNPYLVASVELLDAETFVPVIRIDNADGKRMVFSPDGEQLAIFGGKAGIQLWDVEPPRLRDTIPTKTQRVAFSPDGVQIAYASGKMVYLWHLAQKQVVMELTDGETVTAIDFHPTRPILAVGHQAGQATFWDVDTGQIQSRLDTIVPNQQQLRFSPNGAFLAVVSENNGVRLFETVTGDVREAFFIKDIGILDLGFSPNGAYLFFGTNNATLWRLHIQTRWWDSQAVVNRRRPPDARSIGQVERLAFHPNGDRFASQIDNTRIAIWDVGSLARLKTLYGWAQTYAQAAYLPKINRVVTGIYTNVLHFWDFGNGDLLKSVEFHATLYQVTPSPDGRHIALDVEATNQIWDAERMEPRHVFQIRGFLGTTAVAFSPSGKYLASNTFRGTFVWNVETGKEVNLVETGWSDFQLLLFTPDERQVVLIPPNRETHHPAGDFIGFWDIQSGTLIRKLDLLGPLLLRQDNSLQVRDGQDVLEIFDLVSNRRLGQIPKPEPFELKRRLYKVRFHPTGRIVAISLPVNSKSDEHRFYDTQTGTLLAVVPGTDFRFAGRGKFMLISSENTRRLEIYRTSDVLNIPEIVAVEPRGRQSAQWGTIKRNALVQNYPNPFNPETWIPFRLEKESSVMIRIYDESGASVRTLPLGIRQAGNYLSREKAAYWDGRNDAGESAASGVYFYTLNAEDFSATRKMLIQK